MHVSIYMYVETTVTYMYIVYELFKQYTLYYVLNHPTCTLHVILCPLPSYIYLVPSPLISPTDNLPSSPMTSTSPVFAELNSIQSRAQLTSLRCQELCQRFDERLETLGKELATQSDKFMKELDDVELWVQNVYFTLRQEPAREIEGIYSQDEMDAEEEEVLGQRSQEVGPTIGGGRRHFGRIGGTPDLFSSDGSLGSEGFMGSLDEAKVHDTSVNPDLSDDEYVGQMVERVITPDLEREVDVEDKEYEIGFSMSTNEVSPSL